jgi:ribonuclease HI
MSATRPKKVVSVYTDGSCLGNGKEGAKAGVGVYFPDFPEHGVSLPIEGKQTNNRAELIAGVVAIMTVNKKFGRTTDIIIYTDHQIMFDGMTKHREKWIEKEWKLKVKNIELFRLMHELCRMRKGKVRFVKVESKCEGNIQADELAKSGAKKSKPSVQNQQ